MTNKSRTFSWSRLLLKQTLKNPAKTPLLFSRKISTSPRFPSNQTLPNPFPPKSYFQNASQDYMSKPIFSFSRKISTFSRFPRNQTAKLSLLTERHFSTGSAYSRVAQDLLAELEREKEREREARKRAGLDTKDIDQEDEEDYMGVGPLIEKLEKEKLKDTGDLNLYEEPTDSDSEDDDERYSRDAVRKRFDVFEKKFKRHEELLKNFTEAGI